MNTIILILLSLSLISSVLIIYLNFKSKNESQNEKENQEIQRLNQERWRESLRHYRCQTFYYKKIDII